MIRKAFQKVQKKQRRKYTGIVALVGALALTAIGYAVYSHRQIAQQKIVAEELFYATKSLDVDIANLERLVASFASSAEEGSSARGLPISMLVAFFSGQGLVHWLRYNRMPTAPTCLARTFSPAHATLPRSGSASPST